MSIKTGCVYKEEIVKSKTTTIQKKDENLMEYYYDIITKQDNLQVKFKKTTEQCEFFRFTSSKSYLKWCQMTRAYPEENCTFAWYIKENKAKKPQRPAKQHATSKENQSDNINTSTSQPEKNESNSNNMNISNEAICLLNNPNPNKGNESSTLTSQDPKINVRSGKVATVVTKEKQITIPETWKQAIVTKLKSKCFIAIAPEKWTSLWKNLYIFEFAFLAWIVLHVLIFFILHRSLPMSQYITGNLCLCIWFTVIGISGLKKYNDRNVTEFGLITTEIIFVFVLCGLCMGLPYHQGLVGEKMYDYLYYKRLVILIVYSMAIALNVAIIIMNNAISKFYREYEKEINEGTLLVDIKV